ncbi:hypothetical protein H6781_01010 [Candidatus Nomurabacteria bacterium]|nr:hypothetical protein [Candidatus Nomurabacteria bacterium]
MKKKLDSESEPRLNLSIPMDIPRYDEFLEQLADLLSSHDLVYESDSPLFVDRSYFPRSEPLSQRVLH